MLQKMVSVQPIVISSGEIIDQFHIIENTPDSSTTDGSIERASTLIENLMEMITSFVLSFATAMKSRPSNGLPQSLPWKP